MSKIHVFNAGPCLLPQVAIDRSIEALKDFKGTGVSLISISHRTKEWEATMEECRSLWKELLNIPDDYEVVFLGGGASLGFLYVAMNFLEKKAAYLDTGVWAHKALKEAQGLGEAYAIACSKDRNYCYIPKGYDIPTDIDFETYLDNVVGVSVFPGEAETIRLQFSEHRFPYVLTKALHQSQRIVDFDNRIIEISVIPNNELEALILSFGKDVEVLSPASYREQIQNVIRESYEKYSPVQVDCIDENYLCSIEPKQTL